jgi:hypothetical protein
LLRQPEPFHGQCLRPARHLENALLEKGIRRNRQCRLGPDPQGFITYTADGRVSVIVVPRDRPAPASLPPSDAEKVRLFDSLFAYAGTYTLGDDKVVHHLDTTWNQSWTGTEQVRFYKLSGNRLSIHGAPAPDPFTGQDVIHRVEFEKV